MEDDVLAVNTGQITHLQPFHVDAGGRPDDDGGQLDPVGGQDVPRPGPDWRLELRVCRIEAVKLHSLEPLGLVHIQAHILERELAGYPGAGGDGRVENHPAFRVIDLVAGGSHIGVRPEGAADIDAADGDGLAVVVDAGLIDPIRPETLPDCSGRITRVTRRPQHIWLDPMRTHAGRISSRREGHIRESANAQKSPVKELVAGPLQ